MKSKDISDVEYKINQDGRQASFVFPNGMKLVPILHNGYQEHQTQHSGPLDLYNLSGPWRGDFTQINTTNKNIRSQLPILNPIMCHLLVKGNMYCFVSISDVPKMLKQYKENYPFYHPISYKYYFTKYCLTFSVWLSFLLSKHHNNCYLWIYLVDISTALHWHCPPRPGCTAAVLQHVGCWALPAPAQVRVSWQQDGDGKAEKLSSATLAQGSSI